MKNFQFHNPVKLIFGHGEIARIAKEVKPNTKVLLTYGGGSIFKNGVYDQVKEALKEATCIEFGGIEANPDFDTLMKAVELGRREKVDMILAVGGGSVLDGSKFIAAAIPFEGDEWTILSDRATINEATPIACVLTLPATGSEMNCTGVISCRRIDEKLAFANPKVYPIFSVLDPAVVLSLPSRQIANGIVDTFAHILEQYLTKPDQSMVMDRWAEGLLANLIELAPKLQEEKISLDTCANYMLTATMALNGFINMGIENDWATHLIGHELTALHGLDHGVTLAIVYPGVMRVLKEEKRGKLLQYAQRVWNITGCNEDLVIEQATVKTEEFFKQVGMKIKLSEHQIGTPTIDKIVARFEERGWNIGEFQQVTPEKTRQILEAVL